ncbi:MAG: translation initiation factor IF-3 [Alphaproteobacteria bacterium]|nr:translation initiation factor IF-3 [Alphaproteobacteria bacterium]
MPGRSPSAASARTSRRSLNSGPPSLHFQPRPGRPSRAAAVSRPAPPYRKKGGFNEGEKAIARPAQQSAPTREGPRVNGEIKSPQVRLIDENGEMVGVVSTREAIEMAEEASLDLIEISPNAVPPVAKISDYGKYKYEAQKKAHEARKHQKVIEVKEIKMRPNIDEHDYEVKMRAMKRFIDEGDKVKVTLRFRGREMVHSELGLQVLNRVRGEMDPLTKIESMPRMEGRQMIMVLAPK